MTTGVERSKEFADKFNNLMQVSGKKARNITQAEFNALPNNAAVASALLARMKSKPVTPKKAIVNKAVKEKVVKTPPPDNYKATNFKQLLLNGKVVDIQADVHGQGIVDKINNNDVVKFIKTSTGQGGNEELAKEVIHPPGFITRPVDVVSRPSYAINGFIKNVVQQGKDYKEAHNGQAPGLSGLWNAVTSSESRNAAYAGITGQEKASSGEVVEQMFPKAPRWAKIAASIPVTVATDPFSYVSGGTETAIRGATGEEQGAEAVSKLIKDSLPKIAEGTPVEKLTVRSITPTGMYGPSIPLSEKIAFVTSEAVADNLVKDIAGGMKKGSSIGVEEAVQNATQSIAAQSHEGIMTNLEKNAKSWMAGEDPLNSARKWPVAKVAKLKADDPVFKEWHDAISKLSPTDPDYIRHASELAQEVVERQTADIYAKAQEALTNRILKVPTIEILGKKIASLDTLGEAIHGIKTSKLPFLDKSLQSMWRAGFGKAFSHSANFPGVTFLLESHQRTLGVKAFENEAKDLFSHFNGTDAKLRKLIGHDLGTAGNAAGHQATDELRLAYQRQWQAESAAGLKDAAKNPYNPNYQYYHVTGNADNITRFESLQKKAMHAFGGAAKFDGVAEAKSLGLKVEEDPFKNFLYRNAESHRKIAEARFIQDLAVNYGIVSKMSKDAAWGMDLKPLTKESFLNTSSLKPGETLYLHKDIHETIDAVKKLVSGGIPDDVGMAKMVQALDNITKKFKTWNTVYFPGYHVKNFMSDMYIGALDGVGPRDYGAIMRILHKDPAAIISIGGESMTKGQFKSLYDEWASSGFISTETGFGANKFSQGVRKAAEWREDFGRIAHFKHAMDEELPAIMNKISGKKTPTVVQKAIEKAAENAAYRVNKFKFDFGALAPAEKNFMRRGIPFYTYARKAIPIILESALLNPKVISYTNAVTNALGSGDAGQQQILPQWLQDIGYGEIIGGTKPWGITDDFTANPTLTQLRPSGIADQLNPVLQGLIELKTNKDTFSGKKISGGVFDPARITNKLRAVQVVNRGMKHTASWAEQALQLLGLPLRQINTPRAESAIQEKLKDLKTQLKELSTHYQGSEYVDTKNKGFNIFLSERQDGTSIRITDPSGVTIDEDFASIKEAKDWLKEHNA